MQKKTKKKVYSTWYQPERWKETQNTKQSGERGHNFHAIYKLDTNLSPPHFEPKFRVDGTFELTNEKFSLFFEYYF